MGVQKLYLQRWYILKKLSFCQHAWITIPFNFFFWIFEFYLFFYRAGSYPFLILQCTLEKWVRQGPKITFHFKKNQWGTSLVAQWLRIRLPMQGTRVRSLVWEDPTCCGATKALRHNYWACALKPVCHNYVPRARAPQQEKPLQWEACASQRRVAPARCN